MKLQRFTSCQQQQITNSYKEKDTELCKIKGVLVTGERKKIEHYKHIVGEKKNEKDKRILKT